MAKDLLLFRDEVIKTCEDSFPEKSLDIFNYNDFNVDVNELQLLEEVGKGAYGHVRSAMYHGRVVAVKIQPIPDQVQMCANIMIELSTMQSLPHDKLVRYIGAGFRTGENNIPEVLIVMELCERGSLRHCLKVSVIPWKLRVRLALDAAWGIVFLHENNIIHRDIKTGNVLVDKKWRAKLCDMAFSCHQTSPTRLTLTMGTEEFMAPEISLAYDCDLPSDIFSFGIMLCEIITGKEPSEHFLHRKAQTKFEIKEEEIRNNLLDDCPEGLEALAYLCLDAEPKRRPNILQVIEELETILLDLGGDDFVVNDAETNESQELTYRPRRISHDASFSQSDDIYFKVGLLESQLNELKLENVRLANELSFLKGMNPNVIATNEMLAIEGAIGGSAIATCEDTATTTPPFTYIVQAFESFQERLMRLERLNNLEEIPEIHIPLENRNDIPPAMWDQVNGVLTTLMGFSKRLESLEQKKSRSLSRASSGRISSGDEDIPSDQEVGIRSNAGVSVSPNTWQSVAEFLAATVAAQQKQGKNINNDTGSENSENLSRAVDHLALNHAHIDDVDSAKQLLSSLESFLSTVGLYNNALGEVSHSSSSDVLDEVDKVVQNSSNHAVKSVSTASKRGHSLIIDSPTGDNKGIVRTPKISRIGSGNSLHNSGNTTTASHTSNNTRPKSTSISSTNTSSTARDHTVRRKSDNSTTTTRSITPATATRVTNRSSTIQSTRSHSRSGSIDSQRVNHAHENNKHDNDKAPSFSFVESNADKFRQEIHNNAFTTHARPGPGRAGNVSKPRIITTTNHLRKGSHDTDESTMHDISAAVIESQKGVSPTNGFANKKGIVNLKDIIIEQKAREKRVAERNEDRSESPSSTSATVRSTTSTITSIATNSTTNFSAVRGNITQMKESVMTKSS